MIGYAAPDYLAASRRRCSRPVRGASYAIAIGSGGSIGGRGDSNYGQSGAPGAFCILEFRGGS